MTWYDVISTYQSFNTLPLQQENSLSEIWRIRRFRLTDSVVSYVLQNWWGYRSALRGLLFCHKCRLSVVFQNFNCVETKWCHIPENGRVSSINMDPCFVKFEYNFPVTSVNFSNNDFWCQLLCQTGILLQNISVWKLYRNMSEDCNTQFNHTAVVKWDLWTQGFLNFPCQCWNQSFNIWYASKLIY
jgi:hypothetical protein